jgi:hypothetical protein
MQIIVTPPYDMINYPINMYLLGHLRKQHLNTTKIRRLKVQTSDLYLKTAEARQQTHTTASGYRHHAVRKG